MIFPAFLCAQEGLQDIIFDQQNLLNIRSLKTGKARITELRAPLPLFSLQLDSLPVNRLFLERRNADTNFFSLPDSLQGWVIRDREFTTGVKLTVRIINRTHGSHSIENLVPLGASDDKVYISAEGSKEWPQYLCRSKLFRPGFGPVGVVLPDNAWHLGFADMQINDTLALTALARRGLRDTVRTKSDRWKVTIQSGGWTEYNLWFSIHSGPWQNGLKSVFQDHWLYDLPEFDDGMFRRTDLQWMKSSYIMLLQFAWDKKYYNYDQKRHTFYQNLFEYDSLTGGYDIFTLWPTWPRLGLDQRNQWDMYRDLPGGLAELRKQVDFTHRIGKKYFISYNPWDEGTRKEDQLTGMEALLKATDADGVVLDTRGASSRELQAVADRVKPGIIMYSEGMAVPKDMPGIVSGRVHDALVMPPPLNLNKFIRPDFAIFRVLQLADDRLHREIAISFFNGYGVEINTMRPGRPDWIKEEFTYLGRTSRILRENSSIFTNYSLDPLIPTLIDSIYVNSWGAQRKRLYTIYCVHPGGCNEALFKPASLKQSDGTEISFHDCHLVDLWNHCMVEPVLIGDQFFVPVKLDSFNPAWLNTRCEGSSGCIAVFPKMLSAEIKGNILTVRANTSFADSIVITGENPSYQSKQFTFLEPNIALDYRKLFAKPVEKIVVQMFAENELVDELVINPGKAVPVLLRNNDSTVRVDNTPDGMVRIVPGSFKFYTQRAADALDPFIPFPDYSDTMHVTMPCYYMDQYPVTNKLYKIFVDQSSYNPYDTTNYLKHWLSNKPRPGTEELPVVYVNLDDARAYARWAGKRLPSEIEWQYAAQGQDMRRFPWGSSIDSTRCNYNKNFPTPVNMFPTGASPFGVCDMVGNVWQMTAYVYDNGSYFFNIIRGGSYYHPTQSIWYVTGGPQPVCHPEMLLLVAPGLDRNSTVGFRCVQDSN